MPGRYAVTDAGQRLFGDMTRTLSAFLQEKRDREERLNYRAEQKRRYDERMAMEKQKLAQQQATAVLGIQARMAEMPASRALEFAPAAAAAFPQMGATGEAAAAQYAPSPVDPRVVGLAEGLTGFSGGFLEGEGPGEGPLPPGGGGPRQYPYPGTFALTKRAGREAAGAAGQREDRAATDFFKMLGKVAPMAAAKGLGQHLGQPGETTAPPDVLRHIEEAMAEASEARQAKERVAAARGAGRRPPQTKLLPGERLKGLVQGRNWQDFAAEAPTGSILPSLKGASREKVAATWERMIGQDEAQAMNRSARYAKDQEIRTLRGEVQRTAARVRSLKPWDLGYDELQQEAGAAVQALRDATLLREENRLQLDDILGPR